MARRTVSTYKLILIISRRLIHFLDNWYSAFTGSLTGYTEDVPQDVWFLAVDDAGDDGQSLVIVFESTDDQDAIAMVRDFLYYLHIRY